MSAGDFEAMRSPLPHGGIAGPHHGYDPNQPRVPAGHRDGGQWTRTPGSGGPPSGRREAFVDRNKQESWGSYVNTHRPDGTLAEQRVFNRDGSRIVSEFNVPGGPGDWDERHTVTLPGGGKVTFQSSGDVQEIYDGDGRLIGATVWTEEGPRSLPVGELAFLDEAGSAVEAAAGYAARFAPGPARAVAAAALALFAWLSARKDPNRTAVFAFKAAKYEKSGPEGRAELSWVGYVKQDELEGVCNKLPKVRQFTDEAVKEVRDDKEYRGPASFGSRVHKVIADKVKTYGDPDFKSEVSAIKSKLAAKYGEKGSIRIDAYENRPAKSTVCVYDPKTGLRGLSFPRMGELAKAARLLFNYDPQHIIVIEVRPGQGQPW
jgi:hypothetical protein